MTRGAIAVSLVAALTTGCGMAMRPVVFEAKPADWEILAGEWRGEYS